MAANAFKSLKRHNDAEDKKAEHIMENPA